MEMWPREFVTYPRSHNLSLGVLFSFDTTCQVAQVAHGSSVHTTWRKNFSSSFGCPSLPFSAYYSPFLLRFYPSVSLGAPLPPIPTCGKREAVAFRTVLQVSLWTVLSSVLSISCWGKNTSFVWACDRLAWLGRRAGFPNSCGCVSSWMFPSWLWFLSQRVGV